MSERRSDHLIFWHHAFYSIKLYCCETEISFIYCNRNFGNAFLYLNSKRYRKYVIKVYGVGECEGKFSVCLIFPEDKQLQSIPFYLHSVNCVYIFDVVLTVHRR